MKYVCYFERLLNPDLFEQILTEGGDIELSRVDREMTEDAVAEALSGIHGYHTRGGSQLVPENFRIDRDFIANGCRNRVGRSQVDSNRLRRRLRVKDI